jgi:transcriptional repressor AefR-like protein
MVEQIIAEAPHFPSAIIESWQEAGPRRVQREIASFLQLLAGHGLLDISDPSRATVHFMALTTAGMTTGRYGRVPFTKDLILETVRAGVDAFLNGYGVRAHPV